jgi:hypothetical protein
MYEASIASRTVKRLNEGYYSEKKNSNFFLVMKIEALLDWRKVDVQS